jgi:F-type H+-transporting ATPase subunit a
MADLHISISAEPIFNLGQFEFTSSMLVSLLVTIFLVSIAYNFKKQLKQNPKSRFVAVIQTLIESFYEYVKSIAPHHAGKFFALVMTIFLFVILGSWAGLLPGMETIGITRHGEFVPLFRGATADLNITLGLAIFVMVAVQLFGYKNLGVNYFKKFFNFSNPINAFVGFLELISEFAKIMSFAFRLFGNIFAGEVLLAVISFLIPVVASLPFIGLELFVGFIQALVFASLALVFANIAVSSHH